MRRLLALTLSVLLLLCMGGVASGEEETAALYRTPLSEVTFENAVYGGTFRLGTRFSGVTNIGYPFSFATNSTWEWIAASPAFETLIRYDEDGNRIPWLASAWEVDSEALTITIHLQPDVLFHDGTPFNAAACIWNFEQSTANGRSELDTVESYEAVDDLTVVVHLSQWDSALEDNLLYTCGMMVSPTAVQENGAEWAIANPVGTGPFVFDEWVRDVGVYYNKNENYWREGEPYLDRVEICIYSDVTALSAALNTGLVDAVVPADATVAKSWADMGGVTETGPVLSMTFHNVFFPSNDPDLPFSDLRVRQAIAYAIDTEAIAALMSEQGGDYVAVNQLAKPGSISYNDEIEGYSYNPDKARELLAEAGYADGFTCNGYVIASNNLLRQCADIVAAYLADVGITVINQNNDMTLISEMTAGTGKQLDGIVWFCTAVSNVTTSAYEKTFTEEGNTYATVTYKPEEMVAAIEAAKAALTEEDLAEACKEMVTSAYENCLIVPVAYQNDGQSIASYVHNLGFIRGSNFDWYPNEVWMDAH